MTESKFWESNLILVMETYTGIMHRHYNIWHQKPEMELCRLLCHHTTSGSLDRLAGSGARRARRIPFS
jgi:hypothetical protein